MCERKKRYFQWLSRGLYTYEEVIERLSSIMKAKFALTDETKRFFFQAPYVYGIYMGEHTVTQLMLKYSEAEDLLVYSPFPLLVPRQVDTMVYCDNSLLDLVDHQSRPFIDELIGSWRDFPSSCTNGTNSIILPLYGRWPDLLEVCQEIIVASTDMSLYDDSPIKNSEWPTFAVEQLVIALSGLADKKSKILRYMCQIFAKNSEKKIRYIHPIKKQLIPILSFQDSSYFDICDDDVMWEFALSHLKKATDPKTKSQNHKNLTNEILERYLEPNFKKNHKEEYLRLRKKNLTTRDSWILDIIIQKAAFNIPHLHSRGRGYILQELPPSLYFDMEFISTENFHILMDFYPQYLIEALCKGPLAIKSNLLNYFIHKAHSRVIMDLVENSRFVKNLFTSLLPFLNVIGSLNEREIANEKQLQRANKMIRGDGEGKDSIPLEGYADEHRIWITEYYFSNDNWTASYLTSFLRTLLVFSKEILGSEKMIENGFIWYKRNPLLHFEICLESIILQGTVGRNIVSRAFLRYQDYNINESTRSRIIDEELCVILEKETGMLKKDEDS